ncbi:MAG: Na+/H+ antiporter [Thermomicrobiales bacterium]
MHTFELILGMLATVAALVPLAERLSVPYPIVLVAGGLLLGFLPFVPDDVFKPEMLFVVVLPPLLYWDAVTTSWRDFHANARPIGSLAIGLVVATTSGIALVAHGWLGMPWATSFGLGAIVSSTDAVAAGSIASRIGLSPRVVSILEGEGLVNDATALVVYAAAVGAAVQGSFSLPRAVLDFVLVSVGGIAVGLIAGWGVSCLRKPVTDIHVEGALALLTPFAAYLPAHAIGVSGVLAAVAAGLYVSRAAPTDVSAAVRLRAFAVGELGTFLLNGLTFVLIGLECQKLLGGIPGRSTPSLAADAALVCLAVIAIRLLWVFPATIIGRLSTGSDHLPAREIGVIGWAGMRGVIALATALALPSTTDAGGFPDRELIIFITLAVIVVTLVGQGLTLPTLARSLRLDGGDLLERETATARRAATRAAIRRLDELRDDGAASAEVLDETRKRYDRRRAAQADEPDAESEELLRDLRDVRLELIDVERRALVALRDRGVIGDDALRHVMRELDLDTVRIDSATG